MSFETTDANMLNDWLTIGPYSSLLHASAQQPRKTRLLGADIEVWRDSQGIARARMGDQELMIRTEYAYLWVCPSGKPARPLFALPEFSEADRRIVDCDGFGVGVAGLRVVENFLDMAHFPYVHTHFLGEVPHTEVADYSVHVDEQTQEIWATNCRFWQPRTSAAASDGVDARYRYRVMQPMSAMLYKSCVHRDDALDGICLFVQPVDEEHSIAYVLLLYFEDQLTDTELIAFQHLIFAQDKPILENHVFKRIPLQGRLETPTRADTTSVFYRRWLKARNQQFGVLEA